MHIAVSFSRVQLYRLYEIMLRFRLLTLQRNSEIITSPLFIIKEPAIQVTICSVLMRDVIKVKCKKARLEYVCFMGDSFMFESLSRFLTVQCWLLPCWSYLCISFSCYTQRGRIRFASLNVLSWTLEIRGQGNTLESCCISCFSWLSVVKCIQLRQTNNVH